SLNAFFRDPSDTASVGAQSPGGLLVSNQWSHVAVTYDFPRRIVTLYHNGVIVGVTTSSVPVRVQSFMNVNLGYRPVGSADLFGGRRHLGKLDEISIYNRPLTAAEIQAIYNAGSAGKCITPTPPFILSQPANQVVTVGGSATFSVVAGGSQPLSYQWRFNGANVAGATTSSLTLNNVLLSQAGNYLVQVTNAFGSTNSAVAVLTVNPMNTNCVPPPSGLVSWWRAEGNALDSADANHGTLINGTG